MRRGSVAGTSTKLYRASNTQGAASRISMIVSAPIPAMMMSSTSPGSKTESPLPKRHCTLSP